MTSGSRVVVIGGGAAGIATAASLRKRAPSLRITIVDPAPHHFYQPGWTMVGAGLFDIADTRRAMTDVIPRGVKHIPASVEGFDPQGNAVWLTDGTRLAYDALIVAPGIELAWDAIDGLSDSLGRNGVTSNYRSDLAPYTARLVEETRSGRAIFTQPPMPIKCAGAPQKAMYLSADFWRRRGNASSIQIAFHNANAALFGVGAYVPPLMEYIERYAVDLRLQSQLVAVDGERGLASFRNLVDGSVHEEAFDMLHVRPPQVAPAFVRDSELAAASGFLAVDPGTLRHTTYANVFGVGDICGTSNAKTAAAARQQAPVVAENVLATLAGKPLRARYDGYGSCPLTVERGRILLAEFGYDGVLLPTFPRWLIDGTKPSRLAWQLKLRALPRLYWDGMLKGREWLAAPGHA